MLWKILRHKKRLVRVSTNHYHQYVNISWGLVLCRKHNYLHVLTVLFSFKISSKFEYGIIKRFFWHVLNHLLTESAIVMPSSKCFVFYERQLSFWTLFRTISFFPLPDALREKLLLITILLFSSLYLQIVFSVTSIFIIVVYAYNTDPSF